MSERTMMRCDLCGSEEHIRWEWRTPSPVTREEAERGEGWWFEDEWWYVCDTCHELILNDRRDVLKMRAIDLNPGMTYLGFHDERWHRIDHVDEIGRVHEGFWKHKTEFRDVGDPNA